MEKVKQNRDKDWRVEAWGREGKILRESMGAMWIQGERAGREQGLVHIQVHQLCQRIPLSPSAPSPVK